MSATRMRAVLQKTVTQGPRCIFPLREDGLNLPVHNFLFAWKMPRMTPSNFARSTELRTAAFRSRCTLLVIFYNVPALKDFASNRFRDATKEIEDLLPEHATDFAKSIRLCWNGTHDTDMRLRDVIAEFVFESLDLAMSCHALRNIWPQEGSFIDCLLKSGSRLYKKSECGTELDNDWFRDHGISSCGGGYPMSWTSILTYSQHCMDQVAPSL